MPKALTRINIQLAKHHGETTIRQPQLCTTSNIGGKNATSRQDWLRQFCPLAIARTACNNDRGPQSDRCGATAMRSILRRDSTNALSSTCDRHAGAFVSSAVHVLQDAVTDGCAFLARWLF
jgi:hypothetical protein